MKSFLFRRDGLLVRSFRQRSTSCEHLITYIITWVVSLPFRSERRRCTAYLRKHA